MKSSYQLRNITVRTHWADNTDVADGPAVSATYPLGYFREDYEFIAHPGDPTYLDEHNGRICKTPEYPNGIYCYFATVDANHNSAYPYVVGPTFYGIKNGTKVTTITEPTTVYSPTATSNLLLNEANLIIFPNPSFDYVALQLNGLVRNEVAIQLFDMQGNIVRTSTIHAGQTISYLDVQTLHDGLYLLRLQQGQQSISRQLNIKH